MGLRDEIRQQTHSKGPKCSVRLLVDSLESEDAADLVAALDDHAVMSSHIAKALKARGHSMSDHTISRHRRKVCSCL